MGGKGITTCLSFNFCACYSFFKTVSCPPHRGFGDEWEKAQPFGGASVSTCVKSLEHTASPPKSVLKQENGRKNFAKCRRYELSRTDNTTNRPKKTTVGLFRIGSNVTTPNVNQDHSFKSFLRLGAATETLPRPTAPKRAGRGRGPAQPAHHDAPPRRVRACAVHTNRPRAPRREVRGLREAASGASGPDRLGAEPARAREAPGGKPGIRSGVRALWGSSWLHEVAVSFLEALFEAGVGRRPTGRAWRPPGVAGWESFLRLICP